MTHWTETPEWRAAREREAQATRDEIACRADPRVTIYASLRPLVPPQTPDGAE